VRSNECSVSTCTKDSAPVLQVELKYLDYHAELKRIFGALIVWPSISIHMPSLHCLPTVLWVQIEAEQKAKAQQQQQQQQQHGLRNRGRGRSTGSSTSLRKRSRFVLCRYSDSWPPLTQPLITMRYTGVMRNGCKYFNYEPTDAAPEANRAFLAAVNTGDPNALVAFLHRYPYHVCAAALIAIKQ
jgi:hypothetical protein